MADEFDAALWEEWGAQASQTLAERAQAWLSLPVTMVVPEDEFMPDIGDFDGRLPMNATPCELVLWANGRKGGTEQLGVLGCALWSLSVAGWDEVRALPRERDVYGELGLHQALLDAANVAFDGSGNEGCDLVPIEVERERLKMCGDFFDRAVRALRFADHPQGGIVAHVGDGGVLALWRGVLAGVGPEWAKALVGEAARHREACEQAEEGGAPGPGAHRGATHWYDRHALAVAHGLRTATVVREWDGTSPFQRKAFDACGGEGALGRAGDERERLRQAAHGLVRRLWNVVQMRVFSLDFSKTEDEAPAYAQRLLIEADAAGFIEDVVACGAMDLEPGLTC